MEKTMIPITGQPQRIFYADLLRFIAISLVIILHCSSDYVSQYGEISNGNWWAGTVFNAISRVCIPLFVMLSGAFLLKPGKQITIKELFGKRLAKILLPLLFWSIIYVCWQTSVSEDGWDGFEWKETLKTFYEGPVVYHFWYLYMLVGIYLIYPVINAFISVAKDIDLKYFLAVWFFTNSILFIIENLFDWTLGFDLSSFTGYIGYFVLGYYLNKLSYSSFRFKIFTICLVLGMLVSVFMPWILYHFNKDLVGDFTESDFTPDLILASAGLFMVIKFALREYHPGKRLSSIINSIGIDAFGIYLVHVLIMEFVFSDERPYKEVIISHPAWGIPVQAVTVLLISFAIVKLVRLVPVLKKVMG